VAVKILIKRRLPLDKAKAQYIVSIFRQLRMIALEQEGYISSETLRSMENPQEFLVISTWRSLEDWQKWYNSNQRKELHSKVDMLLDKGTTTNTALCLKHLCSAPAHSRMAADVWHAGEILATITFLKTRGRRPVSPISVVQVAQFGFDKS